MSPRYEVVRSYKPLLLLIFHESTWENLPFEVRLLHRWYNAGFCDYREVAPIQRGIITASGYCIVTDQEVRAQSGPPRESRSLAA